MGKINDARLELLKEQLKKAVVTDVKDEARLYNVYVPGAVRESVNVKADNKKEALKKTKTLLEQKTKDQAEESTGHVMIQPRSLK